MFAPRQKKEKIKLKKGAWRRSFRIFPYLKPHAFKFGVGLLFLILSSLTSMVFPGMAGKLVDVSNSPESNSGGGFLNLDNINSVAGILFVVFALNALFSFIKIYIFSDVTERVLAKLRQDTYNHLIRLPMNFYSQQRVGELNSRLSSDITTLQETLTTVLGELIRQVIIIVVGISLLVFYSWKLTLIMLASVPVVVVIAVFFGRFIKKLSKTTQDKISESNVIAEETFTGISNVKAFANEFFETTRYKNSTDSIRKVAMKGAIWRGGFASFIIFALFGSIVLVIWQGVLLKEAGEIEIGELFSFLLYSVFVGASFGGTADLFARLQKAVGSTEHLFDLMDETPEPLTIDDSPSVLSEFKGAIEFNNITFHYPTRTNVTVLKSVSFSTNPGETVAIVGPSGAGKSTLVSLLLRYYEPVSGEIKFDGINANQYELSSLRNQMAIVPQEVILFGGTIKENIAYGKTGATDEEIKAAAEKANALQFIEGFPDGFNTVVGERGIQLSGGQRQRIAIARAVLKDPKILILDEATSSLDSESERLVQDALDKLMANRTSIVIAHRLSTIRKANKILVLADGAIKEEGTHEELMLIDEGLYKNLNSLQTDLQ
ncbi:MAG: multidrug ABC transporter ATP-binding protein [Crocinitomicaceae bacterium]|nr:multidrug ABC transporter ATP-binding protein [Crocinitomicaceae bacterium]